MKINYLHQYFNTPSMSGGTRSYEMARRLVAMGHTVNMITSWRNESSAHGWFKTEEAGISIYWLPVPYSNNMGFIERMRAFFQFAWGATRKVVSMPADVVFATSTPLTIALPAVYASWRKKVPMVFEVRDLWPELPIAVGALRNPILKKLAYWLENFAYKHADHIVALSPGMREGIIRTGYSVDKISVIPNSADLDLFGQQKAYDISFRLTHPELGDDPLVVYAGTIGQINGVDYLVKIALAALEKKIRIKFVVVGTGKEEQIVLKLASNLGVLNKNFYLYPPVYKSEMPNILAATDVALSLFVDLEAMWANSANKFFDALASGIPVAINYEGWQADLLKEYKAGLVLPVNNPEEAAYLLRDFINDKKGIDEARKAARQLAEEHFDRDKLVKQLEQVLLSVVEKRIR